MKNCVLRMAAGMAVLTVFLAMQSFCPVALAEDYFTLDVDILNMDMLNSNDYVAKNLSAQTQGVCVQKYVSDSGELAQAVRLTLVQMDTQTLLFDKDYGYQSNTFVSDVIYLPYAGNRTVPYLVTLYVGNMVYAMPFMQLQPRLSYNGACTYGLRMSDLGLSGDWLMASMLDLNELRFTGATVLDVCASNAYVIGQAVVMMENEAVAVELNLNPSVNAEVHALSLYVLPDCSALTGDPAYAGYATHALGEWIDVSGAASALLYMPMQISYDPVGLNGFGYDLSGGYLQGQRMLWENNRAAAYQPQGTEASAWTEPPPDALPLVTEQPAIEQPAAEQSMAEQPADEGQEPPPLE